MCDLIMNHPQRSFDNTIRSLLVLLYDCYASKIWFIQSLVGYKQQMHLNLDPTSLFLK